MIQIENEYGSFGNDRDYMTSLKEYWANNGIDVPTFATAMPTAYMLETGTLPGSAIGLDSGVSRDNFELAAKINPGVPVFSSGTYTGQVTNWGEEWARPDTSALLKEVKFLMDNKKSFNLYVVHGGTSFGFTAGADSGRKGYEPDVTSYDFDAPINEQGWVTPKYLALRNLIGSYFPKGVKKMSKIPDPDPAIEIPLFFPERFTSIWDNLPVPVESQTPESFEYFGQDYGLMLYKSELGGYKAGKLSVINIHDYATVFLNGVYMGYLDRREGINSIDLPDCNNPNPVLEILAEGMGRISSGHNLPDRKGITDSVTFNGTTIKNWKVYKLPMDKKFIYNLRSSGRVVNKQGVFFRGLFSLAYTGDTYFDISNYKKGIVWVNGHNLGRYWETGPQKRLFCPSSFIRQGLNEILILDLHVMDARPVRGVISMEGN
jgi:beta-galactosidase